MIAAINSALSGIQTATARFEKAATNAALPYQASLPDDAVSPDIAVQSPNQSSGRPLDRSISLNGENSLSGSLIEAKLAEVSYKASIAVFQVVDELSEDVLDITA